ncbi:MAG: cytochrome B [Sphingobacteriaceae bacterium]
MYSFLLKFHSGFRYLVFALVLLAIVQALAGWLGKKEFTEGNRKVALFAMISAHTQLLLGLALYFFSPFVQFAASTMKDSTLRYWTVEHAVMMLFALVLITVGHGRAKRALAAADKHRSIVIFYGLTLLVIVAAIAQSGRPLFGSAA